MTVPPPAARRLRRGVALAVLGAAGLSAGCGGGRLLTTYGPPTLSIPGPKAAAGPNAPANRRDSVRPALAQTDADAPAGRVAPAAYVPQEFGAGPEGGVGDAGAGADGSGDGFDPSAAPSAGPLQSDGGQIGQEPGDLGSAPGSTEAPDVDLSDPLSAPGTGVGGTGVGRDANGRTPLLGGRPGGAGADESLPDLDRPSPEPGPELRLDDVTASVLATYPLLEEAALGRPLAAGLALEAAGAFDSKLKASQELEPLGYYENYRHAVGVEQPLMNGADLFAGYRIGRGSFEPWYQERQTNDGGEFKAGFTVPLLQDRRIDARRAALRTAALERAAADPAVAAAQLDAVRNGSAAYWDWVLAGRLLTVAERLLALSLDRTEGLEAQVRTGETAAITLRDNDRLIADRRSKVIDAERKFRQASAKLSLYLRDPSGAPLTPDDALLPAQFPDAAGELPPVEALVNEALGRRPELAQLRLAREQQVVALAEARNDLLPELDAGMVVSQDVGELSSSKGDKQPLELDTAVMFSVPLQRRKARGKAAQVEAKLAQLSVKQRFAADKAAVEVQLAVAALDAARRQIEQAEIGVDLAERLRAAEESAFGLGESDLLRLNLREAAAASAAESLVAARYAYWIAVADLAAATAASPAAQPTLIPTPQFDPAPMPVPLPADE
ncbi:TolC family protein [Alienimonas californiensis]|uniref:Outer membrane efflux protein n=1 Tax=Alienimonas californiensis TaxID=2527989 RepID=A0A517P5H1_9PLAN|nr:TolC family protein [Alienimonas californiensis]QDT14629.1 Outer membrane efflux protein [Alienimonas californiensis]